MDNALWDMSKNNNIKIKQCFQLYNITNIKMIWQLYSLSIGRVEREKYNYGDMKKIGGGILNIPRMKFNNI